MHIDYHLNLFHKIITKFIIIVETNNYHLKIKQKNLKSNSNLFQNNEKVLLSLSVIFLLFLEIIN